MIHGLDHLPQGRNPKRPWRVGQSVKTNPSPAKGAEPVVHQVRLPLSSAAIGMIADLIKAQIRQIGTRWCKLPASRIAVVVLAVLRHDQRLADLAGGNQVSACTVRRWLLEVIDLLAAKAPRLERALARITRSGGEVVLIDCCHIRLAYGGKLSGNEAVRPDSGAANFESDGQ